MTSVRKTLVAVVITTIFAATSGAQARPLRESAYFRALDVAAIAQNCIPTCPGDVSKRILAFYTDPFGTDKVPDRATVDSALQEAVSAKRTKVHSVSAESMKLAASDFIGVSPFAWALTNFIGNRAKAELVQSAFRNLVNDLKQAPLDNLLPKTNAVLVAVDELQYSIVLPTIRAAFREDLRALPGRLDRIDTCKIQDPGTLMFLGIVSRLNGAYRRIDAGDDPLVVLSEWGGDQRATLPKPELFASVIAFEARAIESSKSTTEDFGARLDSLLRNDSLRRAFVAMVIDPFGTRGDARAKEYAILDRVSAGLGVVLDMRMAASILSNSGSTDAERLSARVRVANAVAKLIRVSIVPKTDSQKVIEDALTTGVELWTAVDTQDYQRIVMLSVAAIRSSRKLDSTVVSTRLLSFAAAIAGAKDENDVEAALKALADPVGSFRMRRVKSTLAISIVGYVGGSYGRERIVGDVSRSAAGFGGVSAPIGIEWSWGTRIPYVDLVRSIGVNFSPIDLGTLLSYRIDSDATVNTGTGKEKVGTDPVVSLDHILAPSALMTFGLTRNYPVTLGIGWQRAARLRTLESGERGSAQRLYVMLGIDLTLLRFK